MKFWAAAAYAACWVVKVGGRTHPHARQVIGGEDRFSFNRLENVTTCQLAGFNWLFTESPRSSPLTLTASNRGVPQTSSDAYPGIVSRVIFHNIEAGVSGIDWPVDLPPGTYRIDGFVPSLNLRNQSPPFEVLAGSDLSCVPEFRATSSSVPTGGVTTGSVVTTFSTSIDAPSAIPALPSESGRPSTATIAGAVVGALVALAVILAAVFFLVRRRRSAMQHHQKQRGWMNVLPYFTGPNASEDPPPYEDPPHPPPVGGVAPYFAGPVDGASGVSGVKAREADGDLISSNTSAYGTLRTKRPLPRPPTESNVYSNSSTFISSSTTTSS